MNARLCDLADCRPHKGHGLCNMYTLLPFADGTSPAKITEGDVR